MRAVLEKGLTTTAGMWPDVAGAFGWVHRAAAILANEAGLDAAGVRRRYRGLLGAMAHRRRSCGRLSVAVDQFLKVTRSYWPGLFWCYDVADLPRTNKDLERFFGSYRYHERRASGREVASPGTVVRGSVRLIAAAATRLGPVDVDRLVPGDIAAWRRLRGDLERRAGIRTRGRRFRRDPEAYLRSLEEVLLKETLPP